MNLFTKNLLAVLLLASSTVAHASFHLWKIEQVYSNADGSVQFVQLTTSAEGQNFLHTNGAKVDSTGATSTTFTFPADLVGSTLNKHLLLATGTIAGVAPDYPIPAHFLNLTNGTVTFGNGPVLDSHTYTILPSNGFQSLHFSGATVTTGDATPVNFSGVSGVLTADVLTYHNDNFRTGLNPYETQLTPANVNTQHFGKLFAQPVDGYVYAQPLYMSAVAIPGKGTHNVVFVATEHDSVYAFDADNADGANAAPLWKRSFLNAALGITTVPKADVLTDDLVPEIGITGTPVIDPSTGTLYCVAKTKQNGKWFQHLCAIDVHTGADRAGSPKLIDATIAGTGDGSTSGQLPFNALREHQRPALLLSRGVVYIGWASHGDNGPYHGWIIGYNAKTLAQVGVFNTTPDGGLGGVWQAGGGLAADEQGSIYFSTGNGTFDVAGNAHTGRNYGDSIVKLNVDENGALSFEDFFAPVDQAARDNQDADLGSSGVMLLPTIPGSSKRLVVASGKAVDLGAGSVGSFYLLDRDDLGAFDGTTDHVVQKITGQIGGSFGTPAFFNGTVYYHGSDGGHSDPLKAFSFNGGSTLFGSPSSQGSVLYDFPGATPAISANGTADGIVWELERVIDAPAVLHAYDASDVSVELYNSNQALGGEDVPAVSVKFAVPAVSHGKVYAGGVKQLTVYGVLDDHTPPVVAIKTPAAGASTKADTVKITGTATDKSTVNLVEVAIETLAGMGPFSAATGTNNWSFDAQLAPGPNTIHVRATDRAGNVSAEITRTITLVRFAPLTVSIDGPGTVPAGFSGTTQRQIGTLISIAATPNANSAFVSWTGDAFAANATLNFVFKGSSSVQAHFVASPFTAVTGIYNGIIDSINPGETGFATLSLTATGAFTAKALIGGVSFSGKGFINSAGDASGSLTFGRTSVPFNFHLTIATGKITGGIGAAGATVVLDRAIFTKANPSGLRGSYTLRIAADALALASPQGTGYATVMVDGLGNVRANGVLADGTKISQGSFVSAAKVWPCYISLYRGGGMFLANVQFGAPPLAIAGNADWFKPARPTDALFKSGFDADAAIAGSLYDKAKTPNALGATDTPDNVVLQLSAGDLGLAAGASHAVAGTLTKANTLTFHTDSFTPSLTLSAASGLLRGSFKHPVSGKVTPFTGIIVQGDSTAGGFFLDHDQSGTVSLLTAP